MGSSPAAELLSAPSPLAMTRGPRRLGLGPGRRDASLLRGPPLSPGSRRSSSRHGPHALANEAGTQGTQSPARPRPRLIKVRPCLLGSGQSLSPAAPPPANSSARRPSCPPHPLGGSLLLSHVPKPGNRHPAARALRILRKAERPT